MKKQIWRLVKVPKPWRPSEGEELIGLYISTEIKQGEYGEYKCHHIRFKHEVVYVSGARADSLFSIIPIGTTVKLVFNGMKVCKNSDRTYKDIDVFTEEQLELKVAV
jgi:hypothetical protein